MTRDNKKITANVLHIYGQVYCRLRAIDKNGSTGVRAVCGLQSSLLIVNLLQLAK